MPAMVYALPCKHSLNEKQKAEQQIEKLQALFNHHFVYVPSTGKLLWKNHHYYNDLVGKEAGNITSQNYRVTRLNYIHWYHHEIIWIMHFGAKNGLEIDHISGDRSDNRLENLRLVTRGQNVKNRGLSKNNKTGINGICWVKTRNYWSVSIGMGTGCSTTIGTTKDFFEACCLRKSAENKYRYHENHGNIKREMGQNPPTRFPGMEKSKLLIGDSIQ
jgi:hypothetical protein